MKVSIASDESDTVAHVSGEVDADNCNEFAAALKAADVQGDAFVIDLSELGFIDSSGISELINVHADFAQRDVAVSIAAPSPAVHRVLEITGLLDLFGLS